jgi:hypothetical protein
MSENRLEKFTTSALERELKRRTDKAPVLLRPNAQPDFGPVMKMIVEDYHVSNARGWQDEDIEGYVFEAACTAVYGSQYWVWKKTLQG